MEYADRLLETLYLVAMSTTKAVVKEMWKVRKSTSMWRSLFVFAVWKFLLLLDACWDDKVQTANM